MAKKVDKPRRGRPPKNDGRIKFTTKLRPGTVELLREIGAGSANDGIERLVFAFRDRLSMQDPQAKAELKLLEQHRWQGE